MQRLLDPWFFNKTIAEIMYRSFSGSSFQELTEGEGGGEDEEDDEEEEEEGAGGGG
jgi:hypothetical protein